MNSVTSLATASHVQLGIDNGYGYTFGAGYTLSPFEIQDLSNITITEKIWEPVNFTQKIESMDDYLQFSKKSYTFEGFRQGNSRHLNFGIAADFGVSFIAGFGLLSERTFLDEGIDSLVLSDFSKQMLYRYNDSFPQHYGFLERYGFHSYDSITSGQYAYCKIDVTARGFREAEVVRRELENVTTDIFFSEERYNEFLSIVSGSSYGRLSSCSCRKRGITTDDPLLCGRLNYGSLGQELNDLLENTPKDNVIPSVKGTIVPYSNSSDFQSKFAKLSVDAASQFNNDARVNFTLREDVAQVLMEDRAKNEYVEQSAFDNGWDCSRAMRDLRFKASRNLWAKDATELQDLSRQILEDGVDNFVGEGSLLYEEYLQLVKECFPPLTRRNLRSKNV